MIDLIEDVGIVTYKEVEQVKCGLQEVFKKDFFLEQTFSFVFAVSQHPRPAGREIFIRTLSMEYTPSSRQKLTDLRKNHKRAKPFFSMAMGGVSFKETVDIKNWSIENLILANTYLIKTSEIYLQLLDDKGFPIGSQVITGEQYFDQYVVDEGAAGVPFEAIIWKFFETISSVELRKLYTLTFKFSLSRYHMTNGLEMIKAFNDYLSAFNLRKLAAAAVKETLSKIPVPVLEYLFNGVPELANKDGVPIPDDGSDLPTFPAYGISDVGQWFEFCNKAVALVRQTSYRFLGLSRVTTPSRHVLHFFDKAQLKAICKHFDCLLASYSTYVVTRHPLEEVIE